MAEAGVARRLSDCVRVVLAPNPGMMTGRGTNTYLVGHDELVVIDPGPDDPGHLDALVAAGGSRIRWIAVTHTHPDHAPGAMGLRDRLAHGARILAFGPGHGFEPDETLADGQLVGRPELGLRAVHTPGHASDHLCYFLADEQLLFSGDHVMNGSTVVIAPPDGDMAAYLQSLERVRTLEPAAIAPGHGELITDAQAKIDEYVRHRLARERVVASALAAAGAATIQRLVPAVYAEVNPALYPLARLSLWAHLRKLVAEGRAVATDPDDIETTWEVASSNP